MFWLWFLLAAAQCALLFILIRHGEALPGRALEDRMGNDAIPEGDWPALGLVIPAAGADPRMETALRSLLAQDYPRCTAVLVTADASDPAARLGARLQKAYPALRLVTAGRAEQCGQKNHSLLCGVSALGDGVDAYVFCDSTHVAEPDLLRHLAGPLARGEADFTTGYHYVAPRDGGRRTTLAFALCVMLMRYLQALAPFTQLWGGAMAMTRRAFAKYDVAGLWRENVVDDCSLSALLQTRGVQPRLCPGALLRTEAADMPENVWRAWMERQVLFLKFCMPGQWVLLGLFCVMMAVPVLCGSLSLLGGLLRVGSGAGVLLSLFWLAALVGALHMWRAALPVPVPIWRWCLAFADAVRLFVMVYWRTLRSWDLLWHGVRYDVTRGGVVRRAERAQTD